MVEADATVRAELLTIEERLDAARESGDMDVFEEVLGPGFRTTSPNGAVSDRAQAIHDFASRTMDIRRSRSTDISIRQLGDVCVLTGTATLTARVRGFSINGSYAYTHVYTRSSGRWQVVSAHSSRVMPDWIFLAAVKLQNLLHVQN